MTNKTFYAWLTAATLAVVFGAVAVALWSGADTGSVADWVAAAATVAAFSAAGVAARYTAKVFTIESEREKQVLHTRRTAQAAQVAVWPHRFIINWVDSYSDLRGATPEGIFGAAAMLRNASDVPVTNVCVEFTVILAYADDLAQANERSLGSQELAVLPPGAAPQQIEWSNEPAAVMVPGVPWFDERWDDPTAKGNYDLARLVVEITFRDSAGVWWRRDREGQLDELASRPHRRGVR